MLEVLVRQRAVEGFDLGQEGVEVFVQALLEDLLGGDVGEVRLERHHRRARALGGTSVLIAVGVALDTMRQMESQMMMRNYEGFLR